MAHNKRTTILYDLVAQRKSVFWCSRQHAVWFGVMCWTPAGIYCDDMHNASVNDESSTGLTICPNYWPLFFFDIFLLRKCPGALTCYPHASRIEPKVCMPNIFIGNNYIRFVLFIINWPFPKNLKRLIVGEDKDRILCTYVRTKSRRQPPYGWLLRCLSKFAPMA